MIRVENIQKSYETPVLKGVSFTAEKGDWIGIVGRNGCGKSTLLSILAGVRKPDGGEIYYDQKSVCGNRKLFSAYTAFVPQENPILEELSVYDNLHLWYGGNLKKALTDGAPHMLGLHTVLKKRAGHISGGMKKRLSIAGALAGGAPVLILDEFGAALDIVMKKEILTYLSFYKEQGGTIVMTTHEEGELSYCTKLYALKEGVLFSLPLTLKGVALAEALV